MAETDDIKNEEGILSNDPGDIENDEGKLLAIARCKIALVIIFTLIGLSALGGGIFFFHKFPENKKGPEFTVSGNYSIGIVAADFGCRVNKVVLALDKLLDSISKETFLIEEKKKEADDEETSRLARHIIDVYFSNKKGEKSENSTFYVTLTMKIGPEEGSPLTYSHKTGYTTWCEDYHLVFNLNSTAKVTSNGTKVTKLEINPYYIERTLPTQKFKKGKDIYNDTEYNYAYYTPKKKSDKLLVWLHGSGEGGAATLGNKTDLNVTLLANKVTELVGNKFQKKVGDINILVPKSPTNWMDDGKGNITAGNRNSTYLTSLVELIDDFTDQNDITKVIIAGMSSGGYMAMNIAMEYGNKYQGYVGICESMRDELISDEDIEKLKEVELYLIYAENDETVNPKEYEEPTIERLREVDAPLYVSNFSDVVDTTGEYKDNEGNNYQYQGHFSWIYFFNDYSKDENELTAFEWMKEILNKKEEDED